MGFSTIIDILGSSIIGGMLLVLLFTTVESSTKNQYFFSGEVRTQAAMIAVTEILDFDFKRIGYCADLSVVRLRESENNIEEATPNTIRFVTDLPVTVDSIAGDKILDRIRYFTAPVPKGTYPNDSLIYLYRQINNQTPELMDIGLVKLEFRYFDGNGNLMGFPINTKTRLTDIRKIEVNLKFEDPYPYDYSATKDNNRADVVATSYWRQLKINF